MREYLVNCELEGVVEHPRDQFLEDPRALLNARVRIHLYQPHIQVRVYYVVVPEYFEAELPLIRIQLSLSLYRFNEI